MTVFRFGDVELDAEAFQVRRGGAPIALEPKALEVLLFLVRSEGRLVTKAELLQAVWPGTFVTESALSRLVAQLRKGLGDDVREARYIETVPTRGYRFVGRMNGHAAVVPAFPDSQSSPVRSNADGAWGRHKAWTVAGALGAVVLVVVILATIWRRAPAPPSEAAGAGGRMLVSTTSGFNAYPAFSPDGSTLAFASDRTGSLEIWIRPLAPGAREIQVTRDGQDNLQPAFSPDGRFLAFTSLGRGGIWVVPVLGGVPRQLASFGSRPTWSPDGHAIAFLSNDTVQIDIEGSSTSRIWLVAAVGGEPRALTERWDPPGGHRLVSFSPDGRRLAFTAGNSVWLLDLETGGREQLEFLRPKYGAGMPGIGIAGEIRWSRDGKALVGFGHQKNEIVFWRYDFGQRQASVSPLMVVAEPMQALEHLALAPDGRHMAFAIVTVHGELMSLSLGKDRAPRSKPVALFPSLASRKTAPEFSRDGSRMSFQLWRPGEGAVIYTASGDGRGPTQAGSSGSLAGASFDPRGRLVLATRDGLDRYRLIEVDPQSGVERTLREMPPAGWTRLSPDGQEVAFVCGGAPVFAVCVADVRGGEPRRLVSSSDGVGWPSWSPDGKQLAVEVYEREDTYVGVVPRTGGVPRRITHAPGQSWPHSWTPDGRSIVFAGQRRGIWNVYEADVAGGGERALTRYDRAVVNVRYPAWSPAGDRVVFEYSEVSANVWVAPLPGGG